jgi:1,4-alpha-glucan branching enzyme
MKKSFAGILLLAIVAFSAGCKKPSTVTVNNNYSDSIHQKLATAVMYEVNIRQITPEGTFKAFTEQHIDRLKVLGVDILWLMPTYPISIKNRKGGLGSYYSIADYKSVNPEFGTFEDFKQLVDKAHEAGMLVILDWVANHTGWDNPWINTNPEWYTHDSTGKIIPPVADWSDVADLNFEQPGLKAAMIEAMEYWVSEAGIDGYRCDAAAMAPTEFWKEALINLDSLRPTIKLAEAWEPELLDNGFDAAYGWEFHHLLNEIAKGKKNLSAVNDYIAKTDTLYADDDILLNFITNHDENSWAGTEYERMGKYVNGFAALTYLMPGIPLIYTGQEAGLNKRLRFFEKDTVSFNDTTLYSFYRKLNDLKRRNPALLAGIGGGTISVAADTLSDWLAVLRINGENKVLGLFNFSERPVEIKVPLNNASGKYTELLSNQPYKIGRNSYISLKPWEFAILEN